MSKEVLRTIINDTDCVSLYRKLNPSSRAVNDYTYYGSSGVVRRATCIYCRNVVATCSAKWKETKSFRKDACQHTNKCKMKWLSKQSNNS
jgi:ribosomal protein L24